MDYDVVIVGSGVAGALIADQLSQRTGIRIILLEAGPDDQDRWARTEQFANAYTRVPSAPYRDAEAEEFTPIPTVLDAPLGDASYYHQKGTHRFKSTYPRRLGGSTWHWLGNTPRFIPSDFNLYTLYDQGVDWPINYDDLEPWYCEAETELGVSGDHDAWQDVLGAHRTQPFPMHKIWTAYGDSVVKDLLKGAEIDGVQIDILPTPQARNSEHYQGRPPCAGNSSCVPVCPIHAKYDATVHTRRAAAQGVEVRTEAVVTKLIGDSAGCVTAVEYIDWEKNTHTVAGSFVVLACHAIENPKILLNSFSELPMSNDEVGRNLMDHPQGYAGAVLPQQLFPFRGPPTTSGIDNFRDGPFRRDHGAFRMSIGNDGLGRIDPINRTLEKFVDDSLYGKRLQDALENRATRLLRISYSTEMLPNRDNRVELSQTRFDGLGISKPDLYFELDEYSYRSFLHGRNVLKHLFERLGGKEFAYKHEKETGFSGAGHIIGTTRMGNDPKTSVVNRDCQSHDYHNLYIAGASVFPTCGTANPTLTVAALALKTAAHIVKRLEGNQ